MSNSEHFQREGNESLWAEK
ncbi:Protein CBG27831 [Caenorhabditis briggsae]|uniref:Protein CBG27831 n=1 Tax=Caenorhabditis briggsae TaxID=6238 RepID=B6IKB3_CAEBR|nr:Protein CBG27831 [Caenorhabditis briggsae]CAS00343.1 Protein CBG27831 [Caenorhabditis briggsae]